MKISFERNRKSTIIVMYPLYLYFLGLSLRNTYKAVVIFRDKKRSYVSVWNWVQRFGSSQIYKRKRVSAFIIDETVIQVGNQHFWLCMVEDVTMFHLQNLVESFLKRADDTFLGSVKLSSKSYS